MDNTQDRDNILNTLLQLYRYHSQQSKDTVDDMSAYHVNAAKCLFRAAISVIATLFPAGEPATIELWDNLAAENPEPFFRKANN